METDEVKRKERGNRELEQANILIVEDDADIRESVRILLESENYQVREAESGCRGLELLNEQIDLVILDIMMPGMSGLRTCTEIRKISNVPVLFLTAKAQESDKLLGLVAGGDDYLPKPFSYGELLGRVRALLRRYYVYGGKRDMGKTADGNYLELSGVRIHKEFNEVFVNGEEKDLSNIEYQMLLLMMSHPRKIFSAQNLYESIWNEPWFYNCSSTVMVHIRKLRVKIEPEPQKPRYIKTEWGKGYKFDGIR